MLYKFKFRMKRFKIQLDSINSVHSNADFYKFNEQKYLELYRTNYTSIPKLIATFKNWEYIIDLEEE